MDLGKEMKKIIEESIILFMKSLKKEGDKLHNDKIDNAINFLKLGWKYKAILNEITIESGYFSTRDKEYIEKVMQKHFSKEVKPIE